MNRKAIVLTAAVLGGFLLAGGVSDAAPRPRAMPLAWQLEFEYHNLEAIRLKLPGSDEVQTFWYMRYTVINRSGEDRFYQPDFSLYTDTGELLTAGRGVPRAVYLAIKELHNQPLLRDRSTMIGKLLQGEDNAKHGVAIWQDFDPKASEVDIFVGRLSGETVELNLPKPIEIRWKDAKGEEKVAVKTKVLLSKTLDLTYKIKGDPDSRHLNAPIPATGRWVMR